MMRDREYRNVSVKKEGKWKTCLIKNKIYFETVIPLFLTAPSLVLAIVAIKISLAAHSTAVRQVENEEFLNQPRIRTYSERVSPNDGREYLIIENTGSRADGFKSKIYVFLKIETNVQTTSKNGNQISRIPIYKQIHDYYDISFIDRKKPVIGELVRHLSRENFYKIYFMDIDFRKKYEKDSSSSSPYTFISLERFAVLEFQDYRNKNHKVCYEIDLFGNGKIVNIEKLETPLKESNNSKTVSISEITLEYINDLITHLNESNGKR